MTSTTATAAAVTDTAASKPTKASSKVRKRAPKACLSCRSRKVRCDVSQRGRPCMNCYLDSETCVVTGRASRFRRTQRDNNGNVQASFPPYTQGNSPHTHTAEEVVKSRANGQAIPGSNDIARSPENLTRRTESLGPTSPGMATPMMTQNQPQRNGQDLNGHVRPQQQQSVPPNSFPASTPAWPSQQAPHLASDIVYSYYPFISISNLPYILPQDVNYLESQSCFRLPTKAILDEFVQQYFLHVHPLLPIFNEGDFWDIYCQQATGSYTGQKISLLVMQALIFSSCNFVSRNSIKALGFSSIRTARATFYRRAKLLYDFECESSPICIAQAALFLSFWTPMTKSKSGARKPNSTWLGIAIQHAKAAEAHRYASFTPSGPNGAADTQLKRQNLLKRLWWCCIIRDRILPLGLRRSIQITRAHFDFDANSALGAADLADEIERSKVYNPGTKRALIEILGQLIDLCVLLTDMLVLVYPLDETPGWGKMIRPDEMERVRDGKVALRRWYKGATLQFPMFGGGTTARTSSSISDANGKRGGKEFHHDSVILYTNLMYMYYHCSRVALCHHEVLHLAMSSGQPNSFPRDFSSIYENRHELQDAASGVTECLKELVQLRLARWLPISAVACTALPLVLHILDVKLSSPRRGSNDTNTGDLYSQSALKQHRLNILIEAMKTYQPQYDGVDWVSETIRHVVNLAQLDSASGQDADGAGDGSAGSNGSGGVCDWTDILTSHPSLYLRLALTMDLSLSKDRMPEEGDFPASLRGLFTGGYNPVDAIFGAKTRAAQLQQQQQQQQQSRRNHGTFPQGSLSQSNGRPSTSVSSTGGIGEAHMMEFLSGNQMLYYGKEMGIDMQLDDAAIAGVGKGGDLHGSDSESGSNSGDDEDENGDDGDQSEHSADAVNDGSDPMPGVLSRDAPEPNGLAATAGDAPAFQPFTAEEMDGLEAHVLDAFTMHNESPASSEGQMKAAAEMLFGEALGQDTAGGWMEQVWGHGAPQDALGNGGAGGGEEVDTAKALLDAMKED